MECSLEWFIEQTLGQSRLYNTVQGKGLRNVVILEVFGGEHNACALLRADRVTLMAANSNDLSPEVHYQTVLHPFPNSLLNLFSVAHVIKGLGLSLTSISIRDISHI